MDFEEIGKASQEHFEQNNLPKRDLPMPTIWEPVESFFDSKDIPGFHDLDPNDFGESIHNESTAVNTLNSGLEGKNHPETGVPFERDTIEKPDGTVVEGVFPVFEPTAEVQLEPNEDGGYEGTRREHEQQANEKLKNDVSNNPELRNKFTPEQLEQIENGDTPDGYTWHHHQEPGKMQLVDEKIHATTGHTGGHSIWGK